MSLDFLYLGLGRELLDYQQAWDQQRRIHAEVVAGTRPDTVLILEHASVYTAGKRTEPGDRPVDGTPVVEVDRGGKITWHGPGQLVGYPIIRLPEATGVVDYVRRLEEAMIRAFADLGPQHRAGRRPVRRLAARGPTQHARVQLDPSARSPPSAYASPPAPRCTASRSTSTRTWPGSTRSSPAGSPMPGSRRWRPSWATAPCRCTPSPTSCARTWRICCPSPRTSRSPDLARPRQPQPAVTYAAHRGVDRRLDTLRHRGVQPAEDLPDPQGAAYAVDGLDLKVPLGGVHGFLGPNGSGKTTTIRMVLGLITRGHRLRPGLRPRGAVAAAPGDLPDRRDRRAAQVLPRVLRPEEPHHPGRAASASPAGGSTRCWTEVGLGDRGRDKFRTYSLGMKQRLAIAATLLKDPDLLIFDEPTNGLDPAGIHEIRATMRGLADRGKTVLVSSHILNEVQQVADTVSIIGRGRLLAEGPVNEILDLGTGSAARVVVSDPGRAAEILRRAGLSVDEQPGQTPPGRLDRPVARPGRDHPGAGPARPLRRRAHPDPTRPGDGLPGADGR